MARWWRVVLPAAALAGWISIGSTLILPSSAAATVVPPGPGVTSGFSTFDGEPASPGPAALADFPAGFDVWVLAGTPHVMALRTAVSYAVGQLRRYGIDVRFKGVTGRPGDIGIGNRLGPGTISVTEAGSDKRCGRDVGAGPGVLTDGTATPYFTDVGTVRRLDRADVVFCPAAWQAGSSGVVAVALHEMGHAVGLGHYRGPFRGAVQVMNPIVPRLAQYQAGDVNGLRYLAAQTARLRADSELRGAVESWTVQRTGLSVQGWAITGRTNQYTNIEITRDDKAMRLIATNSPRADIATRYHTLRTAAGFDIGAVPMLTGRHTYCAVAQSAADSATSRTLGCRQLSYPPPVPAVRSSLSSPPTAAGAPHAARSASGASGASAAIVGGAVGAIVALVAGLGVARRRGRH